ncbi:MAG: transposase [Aurantimonas coralicida]|uniref:IS66-like element accessory protein TnpA n=1 Tax=Nisaea sp. TaxID=2024842 RepID=UPI0032678451
MDIHTDSHRVRRLEIVETGRRRRWSREEKVRIVEESLAGPRLASSTARRHGISNQLMFAWRRAYREGRFGDADVTAFVPAIVIPEPTSEHARSGNGCIEVVTTKGHRIIINRDVDVALLLRIVQGLEGLS